MIGVDEADQLASASSRYHHMRQVSCLMVEAAKQLGKDQVLWCLVGLLHDIDYDETENNRVEHGVIAAQVLRGKLPVEGLDAIRRHDHRTGLIPETDLDYSLILCDAVSVILEESGHETPISLHDFKELVTHVSVMKPWLVDLVFSNPLLEKIDLELFLHPE